MRMAALESGIPHSAHSMCDCVAHGAQPRATHFSCGSLNFVWGGRGFRTQTELGWGMKSNRRSFDLLRSLRMTTQDDCAITGHLFFLGGCFAKGAAAGFQEGKSNSEEVRRLPMRGRRRGACGSGEESRPAISRSSARAEPMIAAALSRRLPGSPGERGRRDCSVRRLWPRAWRAPESV